MGIGSQLCGKRVMAHRKRQSFHIYATRECIDNSERNSLHWCIYALAIVYSVPGVERVSVDKDETRFSYKGLRYIFNTPAKSAQIALDYDSGRLAKSQIEPWRDILEDPISVEPVRHIRPKSRKTPRKVSPRKPRCSSVRSSRWNGRKV